MSILKFKPYSYFSFITAIFVYWLCDCTYANFNTRSAYPHFFENFSKTQSAVHFNVIRRDNLKSRLPYLVPAVFLKKLPDSMMNDQDRLYQKSIFINCLLPLILKVNEELLRKRQRLLMIKHRLDHHQLIPNCDRIWLNLLHRQYSLKNMDINKLLWHIDIIPPSLALAQAIEETGWGSSPAARFKHSTFGITLSSGVKRYDSLIENVEGYIHNLNFNPAYSKMRDIRKHLRARGQNLCSLKLTEGLLKYSELRKRYIRKIHHHIHYNNLKGYDTTQLAITI